MSDVVIKEDNTDFVVEAIEKWKYVALEKIGLVAEGVAKKKCPVDTGRLRNSITHAVSEAETCVYIGTNVYYAPYVEMGTVNTKAQPFLKPAATEYKQVYEGILKDELQNSLNASH